MGPEPKRQKTRQHIEAELLEAVERAYGEFLQAGETDREAARRQFIKALRRFNELVLYNNLPEE